MAREVAAVQKLDEESAVVKIDEVLTKKAQAAQAAQEAEAAHAAA